MLVKETCPQPTIYISLKEIGLEEKFGVKVSLLTYTCMQTLRHDWCFKEGNWLVSKVNCNWFSMGHFGIVFLFQWMAGSVQFSHSAMSSSLRPHEPQHARPPCASPVPGVYPNSCPLSQWCYRTISSSVVPYSSCPQSFPTSGSFPVSQRFASGGQSIGVSASTSVLPVNTQDWFLLGWNCWFNELNRRQMQFFSSSCVFTLAFMLHLVFHRTDVLQMTVTSLSLWPSPPALKSSTLWSAPIAAARAWWVSGTGASSATTTNSAKTAFGEAMPVALTATNTRWRSIPLG